MVVKNLLYLQCLFPVTSGEIQVIGFRISYAKIAQSVDKVPFLLVEFIRKWRFIRRELCLPDKAYSDGHKKDGPKTVLIHIHQLELITQPLPRTWQYP